MSTPDSTHIEIPTISNEGDGLSFFTTRSVELNGLPERRLSEQIAAENFRLRSSDQSYASDWHVAGDPTLLIVLAGTVRIELRNGETKDFANGELFIAQDYLGEGIEHDVSMHGHRAEVVGDTSLSVLHLKLANRGV